MTWRPIHLDYILNHYKIYDIRVLSTVTLWAAIIFGAVWFSITNISPDWIVLGKDKTELMKFFIINPPLLLGLGLLFWFGFEWSFIPVFLSMFVIGIFSHLHYTWAILFGLAFVFQISIYAIVYYSINVRYDLRSLSSIILFIITSFVASTAGSLGSFIWSFSLGLDASQTAELWNAWWAGTFLQSFLILGPFLYVFSNSIEKVKTRFFDIPKREEVSTRWLYGAIVMVTGVIAVFIFSGDYLGKKQISEEIAFVDSISKEAILSSMESFEIITWVSIWIILCIGLGSVFLIGSWNNELRKKVKERTESLEIAERVVKESLNEKETLLKEIHHRVKNNLAVVTALLDLQYMKSNEVKTRNMLSDAKSRVKSMAFVHETLYQTENFSKVNINKYLERLCKSIKSTFNPNDKNIDLEINAPGFELDMEKAIPMGLLLNELLVNAYKHAFVGKESGKISVKLSKTLESLELIVSDDGVGFDTNEGTEKRKSLGMTIINTLSRQLKAKMEINSSPGRTDFIFVFESNENSELAA